MSIVTDTLVNFLQSHHLMPSSTDSPLTPTSPPSPPIPNINGVSPTARYLNAIYSFRPITSAATRTLDFDEPKVAPPLRHHNEDVLSRFQAARPSSEPLGEAHVDERTGLSYYGTRSQEEIRPRGFVDRPAVSVRDILIVYWLMTII